MVKHLIAKHQGWTIAIAANACQFGEVIERAWRWIQSGVIGSHGFQVDYKSVIEASYHDSVTVLQGLTCDGDGKDATSPFDRASWYALLADAGLTPLIAIASDEGESAALALTEDNGRIVPLRNWYSFTWRQLATDGPAGDDLLAEIARQLKARSHRVTLEPVPDEDNSASRLVAAFRSAGWMVEQSQCDTNHMLKIGGRSFEEYWKGRPGHLRTAVARKRGKVSIAIDTAFDDAIWQDYERVYAESWKPTEDYPAMLRAFARAEGQGGRLRLGIARHNGEPVAAQFWTVDHGTAFIHKLAHREEFRHLSAGTVLSAELMEHVIETDGAEVVDFGTGDEPYKADWMEEKRPRYRIDCINPGSPRGWIDISKRAIRRLVRRS